MKLKSTILLCLMAIATMTHAYKLQSIDINVGGQTRNMLCYTPSTMKSNMPLWIVTHGMNQDPEYQRDNDHLYELIDTAKFVVTYLRSDGNTWDIGGQKDLNFVRQTITEMSTRFGINTNRVYWSGFSMGSMLIYHGIENGMGDVITAFAPCSGIKFGEPWNNCKKPINLIHCHGTGDEVFPISQYDPRGYAMHFKDVDKCTTYKKIENYRPAGGYDNGTKEVWSGGLNGTEVEILLCNNHGHWPSVNYTRETWNFCKRFSKATPTEEYQSTCKEASKLLEQWAGDINIFTALKTTYNSLKNAWDVYQPDSIDMEDAAAMATAKTKLQSAVDKFVNAANTNKTVSKRVYKNEFDPNFHIYLCFGQSNMEGNATPELEDYAGSSERFLMMAPVTMGTYKRTKGAWYVARPPLCRDWTGLTPADYFGKTMIKNLPDSISVGVINVALGGCAIEMFNEDGIEEYISKQADWLQGYAREYKNNPFRYLMDLAKQAQNVGVIKGILLHQGESNNTQQDWPQKVNLIYTRMLKELGLNQNECPLLVGEMLRQDQGGVCWGHNNVIATVPNVIANAHVVSSAGCTGASDGLHFTAAGYRKIGANYANVMLKNLVRFMKNDTYSVGELKAQDTEFTMTPGSIHPLYIMLTDRDGVQHDVTASCTYTIGNKDVVSVNSVNAISGGTEGETMVTATYTNQDGESASVEFSVRVQYFPLVKGSFDPAILGGGGTFTPTSSTARFATTKKGVMGGWTYPAGVDMSAYRYLVADLKSTPTGKPQLRIYDENNTETGSHCAIDMTGQKLIVVDLQQMANAEGTAVDPSHIYTVGFYFTQSTGSIIMNQVYMANEDPTAVDLIRSDAPQAAPWYDLMGRKVETPTRGIYIRQGRKIMK